ncbi:MAG: GMC family oxidoreductase [Myxococcales bacterium]|nr:GMC family oxidoreductase [Myxococcales bacterium]
MRSAVAWCDAQPRSRSLDPQRKRSLAVFVDVSALENGAVLRTRVCVIGSGPAGMTTAVDLVKKGYDVIIVEAGGRNLTGESQAQFAGEVVGDRYFDLSFARLRMFGGTSNHWGGYSIPLDRHDFETHPNFPDTGWPISSSDLDPYLDATCEILEIPNRFEDELITPSLRRTQFQFSTPVKFNFKYDEFCRSTDRLRVCLNSTLTGLSVKDGAIDRAIVKAADSAEFSIDAECFVLCAGAIENSRLLLWFNQQSEGRLVQNSRSLGRYWMEHPHANVGDFILEAGPEFFRDGHLGPQASFALTKEAQYNLGVLNAHLIVEEQAYATTKEWVADLLCIAPALGERLMGLLDKNLVCGARIRSLWEQEPRFENHVALDATKLDDVGIPHVELHWKKSEADRRTIVVTTNEFAREIAKSEVGRVRLPNWVADDGPIPPQKVMGSWHHMGGTRMSDSPDQGIVDRNLLVHGLRNLYLGGSSVFPSGGYANPTLTIVQLALRLGDEIDRMLS